KNDINAHVLGTRGRAVLSERKNGLVIKTNTDWHDTGPEDDMYQTEHDLLFASIRNGKPINNGEYMSKRTLLALMVRMPAYTDQQIAWDMVLNSKDALSPPRYAWDVRLPDPLVAIPGVTKFV